MSSGEQLGSAGVGNGSNIHFPREIEALRRAAQEEEQLFTSWNTNTVSNILSDVRRFESQVFSNIEKQLDYLRRRQSSLHQNVEELTSNVSHLNENMEVVNSIVDKNGVYRSRRASMGASVAAKSQSIDFTSSASEAVTAVNALPFNTIEEAQVPSVDVSGIQTELQELRSDFDELRNQFHNNHILENRLKALEERITAQFKDQNSKIDGLHDMIETQKTMHLKILERLDAMDQEAQSRNEVMRQDLENKIQALEYAQMGITKDIEVKVHGLKDTLSIHDLRSKGVESKVARASSNIDELREQHEQLQSRYFDQIYASINELYAEKASKEDMAIKADLTLALSKADQGDVDRLQGIADELQRRLIALLAETSDKVNAMDAKLDRRSDRIVTYCLKELKKEFKNLKNLGGDNGDDAGDGAHIGKVRCLVCDHVSTQHRDQDVVHSQHEKLTHTLKALRPRSPSPDSPPSSPEKRPGTANGNTATMSRPLATEDNNDQTDFRFRATSTSQKLPTINAGNTLANTNLRSSMPNLAQSAPLIQIISHHLPVDVKMHQAQQLQQQQLKGLNKGLRATGDNGATMFSNTTNAITVKAAELYPQQQHETPSPHHNNNNNNTSTAVGGITSSNAAFSRPKSAPPKRA